MSVLMFFDKGILLRMDLDLSKVGMTKMIMRRLSDLEVHQLCGEDFKKVKT